MAWKSLVIAVGAAGVLSASLAWSSGADHSGKEVLPGVIQLTGFDSTLPEIADPYLTQIGDSYLISGTSEFSLRFNSLQDLSQGGPYEILWNRFYYGNGSRMESPSWDLKPTVWGSQVIWYGG